MANRTLAGVFERREQAEKALQELKSAGFPENRISIVARDDRRQGGGNEPRMSYEKQNVSDGATWGAGAGAAAGLLATAGAIAVPGIGPLLALGPLAGTLGAAATGGIAGGLIDMGIPEARGRRYEEEVRQGRVLAVVEAEEEKQREQAERILKDCGARDVERFDR